VHVDRANPRARWWSRGAAAVVDGVLVWALAYVLVLVIYLFHGYTTTHVNGTARTVLTYRELWPYGLVWFLYAAALSRRHRSRNGETLGKAAMHIRVVRNDGTSVDLGTALMREGIGKGLPLVCATIAPALAALAAIYVVVDCLWPLWDRDSRALHDRLARTHVVRSDDYDQNRRSQPNAMPAGATAPSSPERSSTRLTGDSTSAVKGDPKPLGGVRGDVAIIGLTAVLVACIIVRVFVV
jgi:uncharacterized RDD family membrane protein YckC